VTLDVPCTDVRRIDVRNMTFRSRNPEPPRPEPPRRLEIRFRNGRATRGDVPGDPTHNWTTVIDRGRLMTLKDGSLLRLVSITDVHDTSTTRAYVFALSCHDGAMREVFQAGGEGLRPDLLRTSDDVIRLHWAVWRRGDSHSSPSRERIQDFAWVSSFGRFAIVRDEEREFKHTGER